MGYYRFRHKFFISEHLHREVFHGGIGNVDAEKIFTRLGYKAIFFPAHFDFSIAGKFKRLFFLLNCFFTIPAGSIIVFQFPVLATMNRWLLAVLRVKGTRPICFIADIDGIKDGDDRLLQKEIRQFKKYRYFIVHNESMRQWLRGKVPKSRITMIGFFDFLAQPFTGQRSKSYDIVFAGNLEKSTFLEKLSPLTSSGKLHFMLYGPGSNSKMTSQPGVEFKGIFEPYTLPQVLQGSFGLVWDGDSIDDCGGSLGRYMAYISHHKLSLYIAAGLPLITAKKAASASMVEGHGIGFAVNSLWEIESIINTIDDASYQQMCDNSKQLAKQITAGSYLPCALAVQENMINNDA